MLVRNGNFLKIAGLFLFIVCSGGVRANIRLPRLVSDGMVLQRDTKLKLWGWAAPGEKVLLVFGKQTLNTVTAADSSWSITLPPQSAGGPYEMSFAGYNKITVKDILFGDVWLCSGQSNMEFTMFQDRYRYPEVLKTAVNPYIRQFEVPDRHNLVYNEKDLNGGAWLPVNKDNLPRFSAVAYFFAADLYSRYKVPIGIINAAIGGSPAQSWISEEALKTFPDYAAAAIKWKDTAYARSVAVSEQAAMQTWQNNLTAADQGIQNGWKQPGFNDADWEQMNIPGYWADQDKGNVNGVVWLRRNVTVPASIAGVPCELLLGRVVDADSVFVNGSYVGNTTYQYPQRRYSVPAGVLKEGVNSVVIRVVNQSGKGGFVPGKPYCIVGAGDTVDLKGTWKWKVGAVSLHVPSQTSIRFAPAALYKGLIAPLTQYAIKGVVWYQGESNTSNPGEYTRLMTTLISDWRTQWKQGDFPFIGVQLTNFMDTVSLPVESNWAALRQAQLNLLQLKNTGLGVTIDLGEWNDIHPLNKKDVGHRISLQAQRVAYGDKNIVASGPVIASVKQEGNKLVLSFTGTGSGLVARGATALHYFAIAGADRKFVWAQAKIVGNKVVVWNDAIPAPVYVRYGWADNPFGANLYNKEGLPASPFGAPEIK